MSEVASGVHRLSAPLGEQEVCIFIVAGCDAAVVLDSGVATSPEAVLAGAVRSLEVPVSHIVISHADVDHCGGIASARALAPSAEVLCGTLDRPLIDSVDALIDRRYRELRDQHGLDAGAEFEQWVRENDDGGWVDRSISTPYGLDLGGRRVEVLHTPGHTRGHVTLVDETTGTAIIADAVLRDAVPNTDGSAAFAPTYRHVADYRSTIARLGELSPPMLLASHFPIITGPLQVAAFLAASERFVSQLEDSILEALDDARSPLGAAELIEIAAPRVRSWPEEADPSLAMPVVGHLEDLESRGLIRRLAGGSRSMFVTTGRGR